MPGLGHFYQGRTGKGILYAVCILGLYLVGMIMGEGKIVYWRWVNPLNNPEKFCLYYLGQFFVGLALAARADPEPAATLGHDPILWGFMAEPSQIELNALQNRLGKLVEIGSIYTCSRGSAQHPGDLRRLRRPGLPGRAGRRRSRPVTQPSRPAASRRRARHDAVIGADLLAHPAAGHRDQPGLFRLPPRSPGARIWWHSLRLGLWIMGLLVAATAVLLLINTQV